MGMTHTHNQPLLVRRLVVLIVIEESSNIGCDRCQFRAFLRGCRVRHLGLQVLQFEGLVCEVCLDALGQLLLLLQQLGRLRGTIEQRRRRLELRCQLLVQFSGLCKLLRADTAGQ